MIATISFTTSTGASVNIQLEPTATARDTAAAILEAQRAFGQSGWISGAIPTGGHKFPYSNEADFDWRIIGAKRGANPDGEIIAYHGGHVYKRREFTASDKKKMSMPAAIKYSRGAKPTDPPETVEKGDGDISYVTLVMFRGKGNLEYLADPREVRK